MYLPSHSPIGPTFALLSLAVYLGLVKSLRWWRYYAIHTKYGYTFKAKTLTPDGAQEVVQLAYMYDMPLLVNQSMVFAFFKASSIPTISGLFHRQVRSRDPSKHIADVGKVSPLWMTCPLSGRSLSKESTSSPVNDPRASLAIARTNWLHSKYKIVWAKHYGWREISPLEQYAALVYWTAVGEKMEIEDIPETLEDYQIWMDRYEQEYMVPAESNCAIAGKLTEEILFKVPPAFGLRALAQEVLRATLNERVRIAMMLPAPSTYATFLLELFSRIVAFTGRHLLLPRRKPFSIVQVELPQVSDSTPRYMIQPKTHAVIDFPRFTSRPWYKPQRHGLGALVNQFQVLIGWHVDLPAPAYRSSGYNILELGPLRFERVGHNQVFRMAEKIQGCPISSTWKGGATARTGQI
ncbi:hypothetical protein FB45DRAFT_836432 [Roridomyces roridus]|uniref:ER-bound oxygenase mpaB/mpaB'/Rubber oxygenase catalytic domain-containing protein n=1 Tax=Roridomyces roridus TaxID=1738132 RepID=A0AAD7FHF2_9AGAR|nr:hypothetical protein FB45DRAFT_836432 [Roridomyces roridus]